MPTVRELSAQYESLLLGPRPGPGVCARCFNLNDGYDVCYRCSRTPQALDAMLAISYSVGGEQFHHALASYKRLSGAAATSLTFALAAILWRFLSRHERCLARRVGVGSFPAVTVVPSSSRRCDVRHPLVRIVAELVETTRDRFLPLLAQAGGRPMAPHTFSPSKFKALRPLNGEPILLIDDTWTTGANAQSAAASLQAAGSGPVAALVLGRHVNRRFRQNDHHLEELAGHFEWGSCALCLQEGPPCVHAERRIARGAARSAIAQRAPEPAPPRR